ncbi:universal stress protein [Streptomyces sp. NPDC059161]|uniref:universal stress protein n=1 Tax=Streptomyces sp. NPDC059161 TaxID=3346749 RepID=UPI0036C60F5E
MGQGRLRVYLGAAPGVGKTCAMLAEGQRRRARGTDVVIGFVEPHGRRLTAAMAEGLEIVPRRTLTHRGSTFTEMDVDAVLNRRPQVALVDELAHTNVPGSRNEKRWQDTDELLAAGIDVVTTLNIQHLESLADVVEQITTVRQRERVPDAVVRRAEQVELVDMTPQALRRRMVHGNVYPPDRIEAALTHYFRPGNLTALRELALLWVADRVEEGLQQYREEHGIAAPWETTERIAVALTGDEEDEALIRRAARIAQRTPGAELLAVHVVADDGLTDAGASRLAEQRRLVEAVNGSYHETAGTDISEALLQFAQAHNATQLVLGASRRGRWLSLVEGEGIGPRAARLAGHLDVHLVALDSPPRARRPHHPRHGDDARAENAALSALALSILRGHHDLPALLEVLRELLALDAVSLLEPAPQEPRSGAAGDWFVVASSGEAAPEHPGDPDTHITLDNGTVLATTGHPLSAADRSTLTACATHLQAALDHHRRTRTTPQSQTTSTEDLLRIARMRTSLALQQALEAPRTALLTLRAHTAGYRELLDPACREIEHAAHLVSDLIDLDRLRAGALDTHLRPVDLDDMLAAVVDDLGPGGHDLAIALPDNLPDPIADAALLTRVLTRLTAYALRRSPPGRPPTIDAAAVADRVVLRINHPAVTDAQQDTDPVLRLSRELIEAMSGTLTVNTQPGGLTVTITLPSAAPAGPTAAPGPPQAPA